MLPCCAAKLQPGQKKNTSLSLYRETANPYSLTIPLTPRSAGTTFPGGGCQRLAVTRRAFVPLRPPQLYPCAGLLLQVLPGPFNMPLRAPPEYFAGMMEHKYFGCAAFSLNEATMAVSHSARNARTTSLHHWPLVLIHRATSDRNLKPRRLRKSTR